MTINEIETTLHTLEARHPNLDEKMLVTLLTSSGWEEKVIQDAVSLFRSLRSSTQVATPGKVSQEMSTGQAGAVGSAVSPQTTVPQAEEKIVYIDSSGTEEREVGNITDDGKDIPIVDDKIKFDKINFDTIPPKKVEQQLPQVNNVTPSVESAKVQEPQSLIVPQMTAVPENTNVEPPENLPLKPFESTHHVWPFSRYKDVFHKKGPPPILSSEEAKLVEEHKDHKEEDHKHKKIELHRTGFDGEDEGLILMTVISLFVIILLLVYMYSNGRI